MSAYIVDDKVIDYAISAFIAASKPYSPSVVVPIEGGGYKSFDLNVPADRDALGQLIVDENYASVNYRYDEADKPHRYKYREHRKVHVQNKGVVAVQGLKAIANIDYQSCEHPGWHNSQARNALIYMQGGLHNGLPGYRDAE